MLTHEPSDVLEPRSGIEEHGHRGACVDCDECALCTIADELDGGCACDRCACCHYDRVRCECGENCNLPGAEPCWAMYRELPTAAE